MIAIGDIHGCVKTLDSLLEKLEHYPDRTLVFVGDYIDRGPSSRQVVDRLLELKNERNVIFLRGNHEQMLLNATEEENLRLWLANGGDTTLDSYGLTRDNPVLPADHMGFYRQTELWYETDNYFIVHAGAPVHQSLKKSLKDPEAIHDFLWGREHLSTFRVPWEKTVVFGHTPDTRPLVRERMIGIDTGCVFGERDMGMLTAVLLPEETFIQQECLDV